MRVCGALELLLDFFECVALNDVSHLVFFEVTELDAALLTLTDFLDLFLISLE